MTPQEIHNELKALCAEIGPKAEAHVIISNTYMPSCSIEPDGILGKVRLSADAKEWNGVVPALRAAWEEYRDLHASNTIKGMALAIIRLTAEHGECTDQALRVEFTQQDIDRYGERAAELATEMGGNGPFKIIATGAGNGPDIDADGWTDHMRHVSQDIDF